MAIFTFGREHEKNCEARYVRDKAQVYLLLDIVDAVHDLIEGKSTVENLANAIRIGFTQGRSGVWENAEKWLRKCSFEYPNLLDLWDEFSSSKSYIVRFRVACVLNLLPEDRYLSISMKLKNDDSKKVSEMALARIEEINSSKI